GSVSFWVLSYSFLFRIISPKRPGAGARAGPIARNSPTKREAISCKTTLVRHSYSMNSEPPPPATQSSPAISRREFLAASSATLVVSSLSPRTVVAPESEPLPGLPVHGGAKTAPTPLHLPP